MFKLKNTLEFYKNGFSEYLIKKYPTNYFNYGIDIGACGVCTSGILITWE